MPCSGQLGCAELVFEVDDGVEMKVGWWLAVEDEVEMQVVVEYGLEMDGWKVDGKG